MMPMPPTSSEMPAMQASRMVMTSVAPVAASARSAWFFTWKSSSSHSPSLWLSRMIDLASTMAASTSASLWAEPRICAMNWCPASRSCTVVQGAMIRSSWSLPLADWPLGASTPMTVKGTSRRMTSCPMALPSSPKMFVATVCPSTHTLRRARTSRTSKNWPSEVCQSRIVWYETSTP